MKAVWYERNGPAAEVLTFGEMEDPEPGRGEVRVQLHASGVNPSDVKSRAGLRGPVTWPRVVPHSDGAGIIDRVGRGVSEQRLGERVWVFNGQWQRPLGTAAQYVVLPAKQVVALPPPVGFAEGACLGIPVMTAHRCVLGDGSVRGKTVLVQGGAGVVGHYAIQLAKWSGAQVIATVSSPAKADHARAAGADHVVDYRQENVAQRVKDLSAGGVDRIVEVDFGINLASDLAVLKPNGTIAAYASMSLPEPTIPFYPMMFNNVTLRLVLVYAMPDTAKRRAADDITLWATMGQPRFAIAGRFALAQAAMAHEMVEEGTKLGHVVLDIEPAEATPSAADD